MFIIAGSKKFPVTNEASNEDLSNTLELIIKELELGFREFNYQINSSKEIKFRDKLFPISMKLPGIIKGSPFCRYIFAGKISCKVIDKKVVYKYRLFSGTIIAFAFLLLFLFLLYYFTLQYTEHYMLVLLLQFISMAIWLAVTDIQCRHDFIEIIEKVYENTHQLNIKNNKSDKQ